MKNNNKTIKDKHSAFSKEKSISDGGINKSQDQVDSVIAQAINVYQQGQAKEALALIEQAMV